MENKWILILKNDTLRECLVSALTKNSLSWEHTCIHAYRPAPRIYLNVPTSSSKRIYPPGTLTATTIAVTNDGITPKGSALRGAYRRGGNQAHPNVFYQDWNLPTITAANEHCLANSSYDLSQDKWMFCSDPKTFSGQTDKEIWI